MTTSAGVALTFPVASVLRVRDDNTTQVVLLERADLEAFQAGPSSGGGSGYVICCGWDGTR